VDIEVEPFIEHIDEDAGESGAHGFADEREDFAFSTILDIEPFDAGAEDGEERLT